MAPNTVIFLVLWIALTVCTMTAFSLSKGEVRSVPWKLRLSFSAFMSLFVTTMLLSAILDISA